MMTEPGQQRPANRPSGAEDTFRRRLWTVAAVAVVIFVALFVLWRTIDIVLVLFAGGLLAIFLHGVAQWIERRTPLSGGPALLLTILAITLVFAVVGRFATPAIAEQAAQLGPQLRNALDVVQQRLGDLPLGQTIAEDTNLTDRLLDLAGNVLGRVTGVFSTTLGFIANLVVILFVGLYLAYEPQLYAEGLIKLLPLERRDRVRDVIGEIHSGLRWWLVGRLAMMVIIGVLTTVGLLLLDVPLALVLGLLAALLAFVPYFGPLLSLIPAVLLAFTVDPLRALYVLLLYVGIQFSESYLLTPMMEKRVVSLPPILLIGSQLVLGTLLGFWGLLLAPALMVSGRIVVKKLYVEDVLGDHAVTYVTETHQSDEG